MHIKKFFLLSLLSLFVCSGCGTNQKKTSYTIARTGYSEKARLHGLEKNLIGFSDDFLFEIARTEEVSLYPVHADRKSLLSMLEYKGIDGVLMAIVPTDDLEEDYLFSQPVFTTGPVLIVRKDAPYNSMSELEGRGVGFDKEYWPVLLLTDRKDVIFRPYEGVSQAINDLLSYRTDGVVIDAIVAYKMMQGLYRGSLKMCVPPLMPIGWRLVVKKGPHSEALIDLFNEGKEKLKQSGDLAKMLAYWELFDIYDPDATLRIIPKKF